MKCHKYELKLLVEALENRITKDKRVRGKCEKIYKLPLTKNIPEDFEKW